MVNEYSAAWYKLEPMDSDVAPLRVAIVEDQALIREGLVKLIGTSEGFQCAGAYDSMEDAIAGIGSASPHVALVDIGLPGMSGTDGIRVLKERYPRILFVVLTVYDDDDRIFAAVCAGACGYLLKKTAPDRLLASLREVAAGGAPMSPEVARRVMELFRTVQPPRQADYQLTPHETRLLKMLVDGHNYKTAASALKVSINTISFHMRNIYDKLQVHSKSEAVARALRDGLMR
jgi:DNA-binding NarL/FixJ family response regulator